MTGIEVKKIIYLIIFLFLSATSVQCTRIIIALDTLSLYF